MQNSRNIIKDLNARLFWDTHNPSMEPEHSKRLIIERVFSLGGIADMRTVTQYYGKEEVVKVLCKLNYLDPKTLNFVSKLFNIPRENFRCHQRMQSTTQHWTS